MKAVRAHEIGGPEVLKYEDVADPVPEAGQALVDIKSIGVNYTDVSSRKGTNPPASFPWTPGREAAGVVTAVGEGVTEVAVGDRVAYAMHTGSYAQKAAVPSRLLVELPQSMDFATGSAAMLQGMTAHFLVFGITRLNPGDRALVHAGAGGMGLLLIQMLKRLGVQIFTTVSTDAKAQLAKYAGADNVILYTQQDFEEEIKKATDGQGVSIVYDAVGQTTFEKGLNCLGKRGYMALFGAASGAIGPVDSGVLRDGSRFLTRPSLGDYTSTRDELLQRANEVLAWVGSGELKLHVSQTLPLEQAVEAHRQLEGRQSTGKILLTP
ncbi:MAG TPA: NADPH:quinone reductase [Dehalococcoidia bacterium]|nr:NADPH:quinone reductase [Dehalococcoidia bacterium]HAJ01300.1 NADPH:quinone reductase [Dehalococcoidia bacterium]|tara:strand:+ start:492 stop:1460 length:969 start_codon:yes stop_codon:yes gene_type:complete